VLEENSSAKPKKGWPVDGQPEIHQTQSGGVGLWVGSYKWSHHDASLWR